jgi:hypothetical protein
MIDSGSYCNGIGKSVVEALGLSTWRILAPRHVEWVNSCGMLKITHMVRVPFTVDDYADEVECDVLPLEVCGMLLGRPCRWISCHKNTGYHATDPKIRTQGAELARSRIATKHGDGSLESTNALRTAEREAELYPGSGPSW